MLKCGFARSEKWFLEKEFLFSKSMSSRKDGSIHKELIEILEPLSIPNLDLLLETVIYKAFQAITKPELQPFSQWRQKLANNASIKSIDDDMIYETINQVLIRKQAKAKAKKQEKGGSLVTRPKGDHDSAKDEQKYNTKISSKSKLTLNKDAPVFVPGNGAWNKPAKPGKPDQTAPKATITAMPLSTMPTPQGPPPPIPRVRPKKFQAKFNNHAKGNFYISKEMIKRMMDGAIEAFDTDTVSDEKLAFGYYKESVAMSINDKQIDDIFETKDGKLMIIINIDLHFKQCAFYQRDNTMYLIAMENDQEFRDRVRWCIVDFMSAQEILYKYGIGNYDLPKSSRNMRWFKHGIKRAPVNLRYDEIDYIMRNTHFRSLPKKTSKRVTKNANGQSINNNERKSRISEYNLRYYVEKSLKTDKWPEVPTVPVVVIKGKNQWIEWKKFIEIYDDNDQQQYVGISLRFYEGNKNWRIECMDYDSGRIYYQHRLASLPSYDEFNYSYNKVKDYITTSLQIHQQRGHNHNNHHNNHSHGHQHHHNHNQHQHNMRQIHHHQQRRVMPNMHNRNNMGSMSLRNVHSRNMRNMNNMPPPQRRIVHKPNKSTGDVLKDISDLLDISDLMGDLKSDHSFQQFSGVLMGAELVNNGGQHGIQPLNYRNEYTTW